MLKHWTTKAIDYALDHPDLQATTVKQNKVELQDVLIFTKIADYTLNQSDLKGAADSDTTRGTFFHASSGLLKSKL